MKNTKVRTGSVFTLVIALLAGGCRSGDISSGQYVEQGRAALESGEIRTAIIELKNALQAEPDNVDARLLLGQAYARAGDGASAQKELGRARELGVNSADLQPWLAKARLLQGELETLYELEIPDDAAVATRAEMTRIKAQALLERGDTARAAALAQKALELEPDSAAGMLLTARIEASRNNLDSAKEWTGRALAIDEGNASAWSLRGSIERSQGNLEAAEEAYTKAMEDPALIDAMRLNRAIVLVEMEQWDKAQADIDQLRERIESHPRIDYAEGLLNYKRQLYADAARLFESSLSVDPDYMPARFFAGSSYVALGNPESARNHLDRYLARKPDDVAAQRMMAAVSLQLGDAAEAERLIEPVVEQFPEDVAALNLLASALDKLGKREEGVAYLQRASAAQPESAVAQARLGAALLSQGDTAEGIAELERALQLDPTLQGAAERIIIGHVRDGNLDEALRAAIEYRDKNPDSASAQLLLGTVYLLRDEKDNATDALSTALDIDPGNPAATGALAALAVANKDWAKAKGYYLESIKHYPDNIAARINLARIAEVQGDRDSVRKYLQDAVRRAPQAFEPRLYLARYYLAEQEPERSLDVLSEIRQTHGDDPRLLTVVAEAELALARYNDAAATLEALRELNPTDLKTRVALAGVYTGLGNSKAARDELEEALRLDPKFVPAIKALAVLASAQKAPGELELRIQQLENQLGTDNPDVLLFKGQAAEMKDDVPAAVAAYEKLFKTAGNGGNLVRLTRVQWNAGDRDTALRSLEEWATDHPQDAVIQFELGQRYLELQRGDDAIARFELTLKINPRNVIAMNNLAWLLRDREPARALEYAEQAHAVAPESPEILDTLALVLLANGNEEKAIEMSERAVRKQPENATLLFHQAQILEAAGRTDDARRALQSLSASRNEFPEREEAQAMLRRLEAQ